MDDKEYEKMKTVFSGKSKLLEKMNNVMKTVESVPKSGYNAFHKYNYAQESDVIEAIRDKFAEHGLVLGISAEDVTITQKEKKDKDNTFIVLVRLRISISDIESGETIESTWFGAGEDQGEKGLYKAYTGGLKYWLMKSFLIPTGDDPERDEDKHSDWPPEIERKTYQRAAAKEAYAPATSSMTEAQKYKIIKLAEDLGLSRENLEAQIKKQIGKDWGKLTKNDASRVITALYDALNKKSGGTNAETK